MYFTSLKNDAVFYARAFMVCECLLVYIGYLMSHVWHYGSLEMQPEVLLLTLITVGFFYLAYSMAGMYKTWRGIRIRQELKHAVVCWLVIVACAGLLAFLTKFGLVVSRLWFGWGTLLAFSLVCVFRVSVRAGLAHARNKGLNFRSIVFVGVDNSTRDAIRRLNTNRWVGLNPVAIFDDQLEPFGTPVHGVPVKGGVDSLMDYIETCRKQRSPVDQVWISISHHTEESLLVLLDKLENTSVDVRLVPNMLGFHFTSGMIDIVADIPVMNPSEVRKDAVSGMSKRIFDVVFASVAVVLLSPVYLVVAALIKLDSAGPVVFRQPRFGIDGTEIMVLKFRTMTAQDATGPVVQATRNDQRITRIGKFLRRTSLDEIPQFFNVLRGEMSVVGPRPHAIVHNEEYREKIHGYMGRHKIKPGITGWAQVNGWRGETDTLEKMEMRVKYDIEYIRSWSVLLDVKIVVLTVFRGFISKNAY
ncbi:MAG: undecaprenyl-phosphate glucose phosphotransferase [Granulosicoccus sp.]